jgi:hypothetical protein
VPTESSTSLFPSRVINQGLVSQQNHGVLCGLTLWLSGLLCILIPTAPTAKK